MVIYNTYTADFAKDDFSMTWTCFSFHASAFGQNPWWFMVNDRGQVGCSLVFASWWFQCLFMVLLTFWNHPEWPGSVKPISTEDSPFPDQFLWAYSFRAIFSYYIYCIYILYIYILYIYICKPSTRLQYIRIQPYFSVEGSTDVIVRYGGNFTTFGYWLGGGRRTDSLSWEYMGVSCLDVHLSFLPGYNKPSAYGVDASCFRGLVTIYQLRCTRKYGHPPNHP